MSKWFVGLLLFGVGVSGGLAAFGVVRRSQFVRMCWVAGVGALAALAALIVLLMWALTGVFSLSLPGVVAAPMAGVLVAALYAAYQGRAGILAGLRGGKRWVAVLVSIAWLFAGVATVKGIEVVLSKQRGAMHTEENKAVGLHGHEDQAARDVQQVGKGEQAAQQGGAENCACSAGAVCVGKRGGRYCVTPGGSKRYLQDDR